MSEPNPSMDIDNVENKDHQCSNVKGDETGNPDIKIEEVFKTPLLGPIRKIDKDEDVATGESSPPAKDVEKKIDDGFLSPMSLPPVARSTKKEEQNKKRSPVTLSFRSKFAIPADIYKAPKVAAFMVEAPLKIKVKKESEDRPVSDEKPQAKKEGSKPKPPPAVLKYDEPEWSCEPQTDKYSFEILKMGSIVGNISLSKKEHFVVGRLADCEIKMEHPSISRYHAVVQYGAPTAECENVELQRDGSSGFYVYDLGSTHGTIINKAPVMTETYYRIKVGHVVKFGGSTRMFILQGPDEDQEEEAKETATELRDQHRQRVKEKKDLEKMMLGEDSGSDEEDGDSKSKSRKNTDNSGGVSWGMLEDAVQSSSDEEEKEEEGDSLDMHPDAVTVHVKKDPFYFKDPMKALKNLYEREKMDLDFECTEKRSGHWHVRLCLPVDGSGGKPVYAEATQTGKKKDTMTQCALDACGILERHGMFHHIDHSKQKTKQWEKDDFYDSDEDEFHDRTGELQQKRKQRMLRVGKSSKVKKTVETYESLSKKVKDLENELKDIEDKLHKDREVTKMNPESVDPLDAFMQQVKSGKALDTTTRSKLKHRFFEAKKELIQASKLAELVRPSALPPLTSSYTKSYSFIGKMKGKKKPVNFARPVQHPEILEDGNVVEEEEEEEEENVGRAGEIEEETGQDHAKEENKDNNHLPEKSTKSANVKLLSKENIERRVKLSIPSTNTKQSAIKDDVKTKSIESNDNTTLNKMESNISNVIKSEEYATRKRTMGPTLPAELKERLIAEQDKQEEPGHEGENSTEPKRKKKRVRKSKPQQVKSSKSDLQYSDDPDYCGWLPPENQSGDGKTSLNEKLGY